MPDIEPIWKTKQFQLEYERLTRLAKKKGFKSLEHEYIMNWVKQEGNAIRRLSPIERVGFKSYEEFQEHLAKDKAKDEVQHQVFLARDTYAREKGFESHEEYQKHLARDAFAKEKGFESYAKYQDHLAQLRGFSSHYKYQKHLTKEKLAKEKGFESYEAYQEHMVKIEESIKSQKDYIRKKKACGFLREKVAENVDPESLFAKDNIDFLRKITGCTQLKLSCKIPTIPTKDKKKEDK